MYSENPEMDGLVLGDVPGYPRAVLVRGRETWTVCEGLVRSRPRGTR